MERATLDYVTDWHAREQLIADTVGCHAPHPTYPWLTAVGYSVHNRVTLLTTDKVTVRVIYQGVEVVP